MLFPKYLGNDVEAPKSVQNELVQIGIGLSEVVYILENGFDCSHSKRRQGIVEKCFRHGNKIIKVVVEKKISWSGREFWLLRHAGVIGLKRMWLDMGG